MIGPFHLLVRKDRRVIVIGACPGETCPYLERVAPDERPNVIHNGLHDPLAETGGIAALMAVAPAYRNCSIVLEPPLDTEPFRSTWAKALEAERTLRALGEGH